MRSALAVVAFLLVPASTSLAQAKAQTRQGVTVSFGLGGGSTGFTCDGCESNRESGMSGYLRLGGTVRPNLIVGGEMNGFIKNKSENGVDGTIQVSYITAFAQWYPQPATGFFLKGGLGVGAVSLEATDPTFGSAKLESTGLALNLGLGYDWRVGANFSLTPYANYLLANGGDAKINGGSTNEKLGANVLQIGLGFTWH